MKTNFVKLRWLFTMLLFVTTMIMPTMMLAKSIDLKIPEGDGAGTPYKIGTAEELYWFAGLVNGTLPGVKKDLSANAILTDDIIVNTGVLDPNKDLVSGNDFIEWIPIGKSSSDDDAYTGTFDGNGHTISGLYFNKSNSWYVGLFGCIGAEGKISNVGVSDSYFQSSNCPYIGGVCGSNSGELQNCSNSSTVIGKENEYRIGGVCGYNSGTVKDCKNTGSVRGKETIGGVCGYNERRYNEKGGIIENSFNEGTVSGTGDYDVLNIGGVCGYNYGGTIKSCYNTASVSVTGNNVKLHKAESKTYYCMSMTRKYNFTGIYTPQSGLGQDESSVAVYALNKQGLIAPLNPSTEVGAQRWYLTVSNRNSSNMSQASKSRSISIDEVGEGATTAIKGIQVITNNEADNTSLNGIYDLQGRKLSKEPTHGIYIKNGKKYVK